MGCKVYERMRTRSDEDDASSRTGPQYVVNTQTPRQPDNHRYNPRRASPSDTHKTRREEERREKNERAQKKDITRPIRGAGGRQHQKNLRRYPATFGRKGITNGSANHANSPKVAPHRHCGSRGGGRPFSSGAVAVSVEEPSAFAARSSASFGGSSGTAVGAAPSRSGVSKVLPADAASVAVGGGSRAVTASESGGATRPASACGRRL